MAMVLIKSFFILSTVLIAHGHYRNHNDKRRNTSDDPCKLSPDRRVCIHDVNVRRFYFDTSSLQCRAYEYRGCPDANTNSFVSQWDCLRSCLLKQGYRDALSKLVYGPSSLRKQSRSSYANEQLERGEKNRYHPTEDYESNRRQQNPDGFDYHGRKKYRADSGPQIDSLSESKSLTHDWFDKYGNKFTPSSVTSPSLAFKTDPPSKQDPNDKYRIPADLNFSPKSYNIFEETSDVDGDHFLTTYEEAKNRKGKMTQSAGYNPYFGSPIEYDFSVDHQKEKRRNEQHSFSKPPEYAPSPSDWELRKRWTGIPPALPVSSGFQMSPPESRMPPVYHPSNRGTPVNFMGSFDMQRPHNLPKGYNGRHAVIKTPDSVVRIKGGRGKPLMFERHGKNSYAWYKEGENKKAKKHQEKFDPPPVKPPAVHVPSNGDAPSGPGWYVEEIPGGYKAVKDDTKENGWKHTYTRIFLEHPSGLAGTSFWSMESEYDPTKGQGDEMENEIIREQRKIQQLDRPPEDDVVLSDLDNHFLKPMIPQIPEMSNIKPGKMTNDMTSTYTSQISFNTTKVTNDENKTQSVLTSAFISKKSSVTMNKKSTLTPANLAPSPKTTNTLTPNNIQMDPSQLPSKHASHPVVSPNLASLQLTSEVNMPSLSSRLYPIVPDSSLRAQPGNNLKGKPHKEEQKLPLINTTNIFTSLDLDVGSGDADDALEEITTPAYVAYTASFDEQSTTPKNDSVDMIFDKLVPFTTPVFNSKETDTSGKKMPGKPRIATKKLTPQDAKRIVPPPVVFEGERIRPKQKKFKIVSQGISPPYMGQGEPKLKNIHENYVAQGPTGFGEIRRMNSAEPRVLPDPPKPVSTQPSWVDDLEIRPEMTSGVLFADDNQEILKETPSQFERTPFDKPHWEPMQRANGPNLPPYDLQEGKMAVMQPPMAHHPPPHHDFEAISEADMLIENALGPRQENPHEGAGVMPPPVEPPQPMVKERQGELFMMNKPQIRTAVPRQEHLHVAEPQTFPPACYQQVNPGPCRAMIRRWYYNSQHGRCMIFYYGGCEGNANSFNSEDQCMNACGGLSFSPIDAPLPERRNSLDPPARRFSYSPDLDKAGAFPHNEERHQSRPQSRRDPEVRGLEQQRNLAMPQRPFEEDKNAHRPAYVTAPEENQRADRERADRERADRERADRERAPRMPDNDEGNILKKVEREEKPLNQMWPSFLQLLHRGLYMSAWKMQHKPTPAPTQPDTSLDRTNFLKTEDNSFYITTTEKSQEPVTEVKFTDTNRLVTDNHNIAPTGSTLPSKEIPTVQPKSDEEETYDTEKEEESNSAAEVEDEVQDQVEEGEDNEEDNRTEPEVPVKSKKGKKQNKGKKMKMRIQMVLPFMKIFLNKYQPRQREKLWSNLLSSDRPTMMPWGMRRMKDSSKPWKMVDERPRPRSMQNKNGLTVMQVFMHKSEDRTPWWARRRPEPSYYHHDMLPLSHSYGRPQPEPHQEIHSHYSTIIYRPSRPTYDIHRPPYQRRPFVQPFMPFNPMRVIFRPNILPPVGEPNMGCLQPLEMGMCHGEEPRNSGFRYYYNQEQRTCSVFYHLGCRTNKNNFATLQECADTCRVTTPKPTNFATTEAATVAKLPEVITEEPKMIEANEPVEENELSGDENIMPSVVEEEPEPKTDVARSRVRFASEEEYATIIAILALGAAALLVLIILCSMHVFRRITKSRTSKKASIVKAVLRAHILGDLPGLPYGNKDMKKSEKIVPELPQPIQSSV